MSADPSNAVPSDTLDFVVGGIPRSGTTALAIALCAHPEVYAYASETGLFRFAHEFFRRGPFPKSGFEALRTQIETDLDTALTLHTRDFVVQQARDLELLARAFPDQRLFPLLDDLAAAFFIDDATRVLAGGVHGAAAYRAVANLLGSTFRARSGRRIVGEKTPDNIKALADLRTAIPSMKAIATVRDPFATLKSMAQRAARGEQHDREFSRHLVRNIGNYLDNLQTLVTAQAAGDQLLVLRYEDLLDDGAGVMRRAFAHLGASDDEAAVSLAAAILRPRPDRAAAADYFHPAERALIARVLAPSVAPFGYTLDAPETVEFSGATRATDPALVAALAERRPMLLAMSGFHGQESEFSGALMSSSATALLVLPEEIGETTIDIWSGVDRASPLEENRLRLTDATGREVYGCDIGSRGEQSTVRLITDELLLEPLFNGLRYMVLDMTASNSVRPVALKSGEATGDLREQALQTRGSAFHEWAALAQRYRTIAEDLRSQLTGQRHLIVAAERRAAAAEEQQGFLGQQLAAERAFLAAEREKFADNLARAEQTLAEARAAAEAALAAERALLEEERAKSEQALAQAEATLAEERRKAEAALAAERALLEEERTKAVAEFERLTAEFAAERQDFQARIAEEQRYLAVERAEAIRNIEHERSEAQRLVAHEQAVLAAERAEALRNIEHERARADALMASTSWRITAPLRKATEGTRRVKRVTKRIAWHAGKVGLGLLPLPASTKTSLKTVIARRITAPPHAPVQSSLLIEPSIGAVSPAAFEIPAALDLAAATPAPSPAAPSEPTTQPAASRPPPENAAARFRHADQRQRRRPANVPAPPEGVPEVSIVIPVYNQLDYTLQCLDSVVRYTHGITYETIVVDDCSTDRTQAILSADPRIVYHRNAENLGFIGSCHAGANRAQGRYLVFLNNDTEVLTNWLIELVETLEYAPDAGIAGAQLVFPNGILQEAGGIVWQDGSAWNYGRMKDPMAPEVSYLREADYVSGAALAISKELWQQSGGFDFHYRPAYGEDSDLCFRVRSLGLKVYYQPLAKVIHYEGISSGTDTSQGVKAYQVTNAKKLYERWKDDMARHRPNAEAPEREKERDTKKRMLVIDACTPEPDKDAGSITAWEIMRSAQSLGYKVTFIPESNFTYLGRYSDDLARVGIEAIHYPFETTVQGHLEKRGGEYDAVLVFRGPLMAKYAEVIRRLAPRARLIFHTSDLHYLRAEREAELDGTRSLRAESLAKQKMQELAVIDAVDCTIVHSTHESEVLAREKVKSEVVVFPWIMDVHGRGPGFAERHGIMFLGGYQHPPNVDAVEYFASAILPLVARELPGVPFYAVGSKPPEKLRQLPGVTVSGFVEDLRDYVDRCRIAVVPLRYGAGIKGKLATSMSYGLPSVTTSMGAEGMELVDGREVVIADTPEAFAAAVVKLYRDEAIWNAISDAGLAYVDRMYSRAAGRRIIATVLGDTESGAA